MNFGETGYTCRWSSPAGNRKGLYAVNALAMQRGSVDLGASLPDSATQSAEQEPAT